MKTIKLVIGLLLLSTALWAQGDGDNSLCTQPTIVGNTDNTCNSWPNSCAIDHGCIGLAFTVDCTGNYDIDAWLTCPGGNDDMDCAVCVNIQKVSGFSPPYPVIATCSTTDICGNSMSNKKTCRSGVYLTTGIDYILNVCKIYCPDSDCDHCDADCVAHGCLRYASTAHCW